MAEGRMLKKAVSTSRRLAELKTDTARLLYTWLIPHLDIEGRFLADPYIIKGNVVPRIKHIGIKRIETCLKDMETQDLIVLYEFDGDKYLEFKNFKKHQQLRPDKEKPSSIPSPAEGREEDGSSPAEVKIREVKINKNGENSVSPVDNSPGFACPLHSQTKEIKTWVAKEVKEKLGSTKLGNKELTAYLNCALTICYFVRRRWRYDRYCVDEDFEQCRKFFVCCLDDLKDALDRGLVKKFPPAYLHGIVEKSINNEGEDWFKEAKR